MRWAESGAYRWQGGTLKGVRSKLDYLDELGVSAIWLSPVFKQRGHLDTFHGYGIQHFLDVDPRYGTRRDLVELVDAAHQKGIRIILDIIFNHTGYNWVYPGGAAEPSFKPFPDHYDFGAWLGRNGEPVGAAVADVEQGVWPAELQDVACYTRAGKGDLGAGSLDDPHAEHKRTDFFTLRDLALDNPGVLNHLADCYKYWIALSDCDGFRIDTLKHVSFEEGRNFCGAIKEFAANLGKAGFLLIGEVAGGDFAQDRYLDVLGRNLDAALDIGEMRPTLHDVGKGLAHPRAYFDGFDAGNAEMGSHRNLGQRHVSILDDHDHVFGVKIRYSSEAASEQQVVAGVALQLFTLGIPCIYYGTEQSFAGPEESERVFLPGWKGGDHADRYLREAMFGPRHPRRAGVGGVPPNGELDPTLPGFGPVRHGGRALFRCGLRHLPAYRRTGGAAQEIPRAAAGSAIPAAEFRLRRAVRAARTGRNHRLVADPQRRRGAVHRQCSRNPLARRRCTGRRATQPAGKRADRRRQYLRDGRRIVRRRRTSDRFASPGQATAGRNGFRGDPRRAAFRGSRTRQSTVGESVVRPFSGSRPSA